MTTFPLVNSRRALSKDNFSILSMIKIPFTIEDFYNPGCSFINHQYPLLVIIIRAIIMIVIIIIEIVI